MLEVTIDKLVHGGQGIGTLDDGRKIFAWNALPGERVALEVRKTKNRYLEGIAAEIITPSAERIAPLDEAYLSTSPWQIMTLAAEQQNKRDILIETLQREHVILPDGGVAFAELDEAHSLHYRNKMEYSFWADDDGLHLALFHRASHGKRIVQGSSIAMPAVDIAAGKVCEALNAAGVRGSQLKTVIIRANQEGKTVAAVFVKDESFGKISDLAACADGVVVYYSNPKSPASVATRLLYQYGVTTLVDSIAGVPIHYDVLSFFQVNLPVFAGAAEKIRSFVQGDPEIIDMYAGVGTIALLTGATKMVELDGANIALAKTNAEGRDLTVVGVASEAALEHISATATLIVDPPRAGLHDKVTARIREILPPKIAYLSCNPITQARDLALLQENYVIESITGYNFFPRTPHIESLALLTRREHA